MSLNYLRLDQSLASIVDTLTPPAVKLSPAGLYRHFEQRRDAAWERLDALRPQAQARNHRAVSAGLLGNMAALGMLSLPAALPAAMAVAGASTAYLVASVVVNRVRQLQAERALQREEAVLDGTDLEAVMSAAFNKEQRGGLLTRLYRHAADRVLRHEAKTVELIRRMDQTGLAGPAQRAAVTQLLVAEVTPGLADYLRRRSLHKHEPAAHLLARLHAMPGLDLAPLRAGTAVPPAPQVALPTLGSPLDRTLWGSPAGPQESLLAQLGANRRAAPVVLMHYGTIAAAPGDERFLASLGIELGPYDEIEGTFAAKVDARAYRQLQEFRDSFALHLTPLAEGTIDPSSKRLGSGLPEADGKTLDGYRAYLRYEMSRAAPEAGVAAALSEVNREMHRRSRVQAQASPAPTAMAPEL